MLAPIKSTRNPLQCPCCLSKGSNCRATVDQNGTAQAVNPPSSSVTVTIIPPAPNGASTVSTSPSSAMVSGRLSSTSNLSTTNSSRSATHPLDFWDQALNSLPHHDQNLLRAYLGTPSSSSNETFVEILDLACLKRNLVKHKKWTIHVMGKRITVRSQADLVIRWLDRFKQAGDIAVNADPMHAGLPWAVVRVIVQAAVSDQAQLDALFAGLERVTYVLSRCDVYVRLYLEFFTSSQTKALANVEDALLQLYTLILAFLVIALRVLTKSSAMRALHAFWKPNEILSFAKSCQEVEERVEIEVHNVERLLNHQAQSNTAREFSKLFQELEGIKTMRSTVENLSMQVETIWKLQTDTFTADILYWLSDIPYIDHHQHAASTRTHGTGSWLLQHGTYCQWEKSSSPMILWLHGIPGAGKTKLVTRVIDYLKQRPFDDGLAYFYCNRAEESRRTAEEVLRSFVKQLSMGITKDEIHGSVSCLFDDKKSSGFASLKLSFVEAETLLLELIQAFPCVYMVLDALDECHEKDRSKLIDVFNKLTDSVPHVQLKILISSRRNDDITRQLLKEMNIGIEATDNHDDIARFVVDRIDKDCERRERQGMQPIPLALKSKIADVFSRKSGGMFQWAALHIAQLLDLERVSDIHSTLGKFPEGLKESYDAIMTNIHCQKGSKAGIGLRALQWITSAKSILQIQLLVEAVCQGSSENRANIVDISDTFVVGACQNLVVVDAKGFCRLSHLSVEEYLAENAPWTQSESRQLISKLCLRSLIWSKTFRKAVPKLYTFAFYNWIGYLPEEDEEITDLRELELLGRFFSSPNARSSPYIDWYHAGARFNSYPSSSGNPSITKFGENVDEAATQQSLRANCDTWDEILRKEGNDQQQDLTHPENSHKETMFYESRFNAGETRYARNCIRFQGTVHTKNEWSSTPSEMNAICHPCTWPPQLNLLFISYYGLLQVLRPWIREFKFSLDVTSYVGHSLLVLAMAKGHYKTAAFLLENGATMTGGAPLRLALKKAIEDKCTDYLQLLLTHGLDANSGVETPGSVWDFYSNDMHYTVHSANALVEASYYSSLATMQLLIEHGADVEGRALLYSRSTYYVNDPKEKYCSRMWPPRRSRPTSALEAAALSVHDSKKALEFLIKKGAGLNMAFCNPLVGAARQGSLDRVLLLVRLGADPNFPLDLQQSSYPSALAASVAGDHVEVAKYLISKGANPRIKDQWSGFHSILAWAAYHCDATLVSMLLERQLDVNEFLPIWQNALLAAAISSRPRSVIIIKKLLKAGADPDAGAEEGVAIQILAKIGLTKLVTMLLKHGANVNARTTYHLFGGLVRCTYGSALAAAAAEGHRRIVEVLLNAGADVNLVLQSEYGSALAAASYHGRTDIVRLLVENGANVDLIVPGRYGSALAAAVPSFTTGRNRLFQLLIDKHANVNLIFDSGCGSALAMAAKLGIVPAMEVLLKNGADVNQALPGPYGTALAAAACHKASTKPLQILIDSGAKLNTQHGNALEAAAGRGNESAVLLLCQRGAKVNIKTCKYGSPLCVAAATGRTQIIALLCAKGADVNLKVGGINALAVAAGIGSLSAMRTLLEKGADVNTEFEGPFLNVLEATTIPRHEFSWGDERERMERLLAEAGAVWPRDVYFSDISSWFE